MVHALTKGYGVAALSHFVVAPELRAGSLVVLPVTGWNVSTMISLLRVRDALLTPAADQFQAWFESVLANYRAIPPSPLPNDAFGQEYALFRAS